MADQSYIVLARKHRPRHFADLVGQEHVARTISNAIEQNRVAHALLFSGPRGVGKTSAARILARALNCEAGPTPVPCDTCPSCVQIFGGSSVDVIEIDAASNRGIDEIRELREAVRYPPSRERYKVYIIDEVHMLTTPAFNALLKTLEEPPPHVIFIFATTEPRKIPETILSRCQRFDFRRIPLNLIQQHLAKIAETEGVVADEAAIRMIAQQSEGCMRDAQGLFDQLISFSNGEIDGALASRVLGVVGREALLSLSGAILSGQVDTALGVVDQAYQIGANLTRFASDLLEHLRDLTVCAVAGPSKGLSHLSDGEREELSQLVKGTEPSVLQRMFTILLNTVSEMSRSSHPKLMFEMALIRLTAIEPVEPLGELLARLEKAVGMTSSATPTRPKRPQQTAVTKLAAKQPTAPVQAPTKEPKRDSQPISQPDVIAKPSPSESETLPQEHTERWRHLVSAVSKRSRLIGGVLKFAELRSRSGDHFSVVLGGAQFDILNSPKKHALIDEVAREVFGGGAAVAIKQKRAQDEPAEPSFSVRTTELKELELEKQRLAGTIENHPATEVIKEVFEPEQVQVIPRPVEGDPSMESES